LEVETVAGVEPALLPMKVASSKTGILSTSVDLQNFIHKLSNLQICFKNKNPSQERQGGGWKKQRIKRKKLKLLMI